ncbi:MAG TPA: hypothetical protein HA224_03975 [Nanoarchaeota archaeon]|nr:hypothetical protein [Nanoarchaeota archaeon]
MTNDTQIPLNIKYTLTPIKTKIAFTAGIVLAFFAILGVTGTTISWAYFMIIVVFAILAIVYWHFADSIIKKNQEDKARSELLNEIKSDIKFIKNKLEGDNNGPT